MGNKSGRLHVVPLSTLAIGIIRALPRVHDELVFPARGKHNPVSGYSKWKHILDQLSGVKNWTLQDLRRTAATGMAGLGVAPHVVEQVLNHKTGILGGVAGIYNRFAYLPQMKDAIAQWSLHLEGLFLQWAKPQ
jgi:integrase